MSEQAPDWQAAVDRLGQLSDQELDAAVTRSAAEFADAEGHPDPLGSYPLHAPTPAEPTDRPLSLPQLGEVRAGLIAGHDSGARLQRRCVLRRRRGRRPRRH